MTEKRVKREVQWKELERRFKELRLEDPDRPSFSVLTWAVMEGGYDASTISRAVDDLVDESDYCEEIACRGECNGPHDRDCLKNWLYHLAFPPVLQLVRRRQKNLADSIN